MKNKPIAILMLLILVASVIPILHVAAVDVTLTLPDAELSTQFAKTWGPANIVAITDIPGPGVRFDFAGLGGGGTGVSDNFPVSNLAGGAPDAIGGWGDFRAYTQYRLVVTNLGPNPISVNIFICTGWTNPPPPGRTGIYDTYWENGWVGIGVGQSKIVTLDFSNAICYNAQDDPVPAWRYPGGTNGVIVRRLDEVSNIGFQVCGNGAGSIIVSQTIPKDAVVALPDEELNTFAKETGPGTVSIFDIPGPGVRFDFFGLSSLTGTVVGDSFPVSALAGGAYKDYGSGFSGPYDFSGYAKYSMVFKNAGTTTVKVNLKMNTGWTDPPWGRPENDTFWQNGWTTIAPGESRVVTLDFWSAEVYNAWDDPVSAWQYADGTSGMIVRRLDEVSDIGFQVLGGSDASLIVIGETIFTLSDAEMGTQFAKETGPGTVTITDIPGPGVKFDFTGLTTNTGTVVGDNFPVSALAGGAYKTYGVTNPFSTWGDFFEYTKYRLIFTNIGQKPVTVNLKVNTGWAIPPPEYAAGWRDTFWQNTWTSIDPGESKVITLDFSSAEVWNTGDELEYKSYPDGTTGVTVWRLDEVSDIGFQILGDGEASIIVSAHPAISEAYVDDDYTISTPGWGYDHFAKIQDGVDAVVLGGIVHVYDGAYDEQVVINKRLTIQGTGSTPIVRPSSAAQLTTILDGYYWGGTKQIAGIIVANVADGSNVTVKNLIVDGEDIITKPTGADYVTGIFYRETGGLIDTITVDNMTIDATGTAVRGYGIYLSAIVNTVSVEIKGTTITNYDKNGINVHGNKLTVNIHHNTITGRGYLPGGDEVQNGILVMDDAKATVNNNTISNMDYMPETWWSAGVLLIDGGDGSSANYNTITDCQIGIVFQDMNGSATGNTINGGTIGKAGLILQQGWSTGTWTASFVNNTVSGCDTEGIGVHSYDAGTSLSATIDNNQLTGGLGDGIYIGDVPANGPAGSITATIKNNVISSWQHGIYLVSSVTGAIITGNNIHNNQKHGIKLATDSNVVRYNKIENNGQDGIFIESDNNVIERNKITGNVGPFSGIHLTSSADGNEIHYNCIVGNVGTNVYGIYKEGGSTVNATYNWWGDSAGPYHPTKNPLGSGNQVSDYVLFKPWLKAYFDYFRKYPVVNEPVTFDATLSTKPCNIRTILSYTWNFDDGTGDMTETDPIIVHAFAAARTYNVTLRLTYDDTTTATEWALVYVSKRPYFKVEPDLIEAGMINKTFNVNVTINDLDVNLGAVGFQFRLSYNATLLEVLNVTEGPFVKDLGWNLHGTFFMYYIEDETVFPNGTIIPPHIIVGIVLLPNSTGKWEKFPYGNGVLATITFKTLYQEKVLDPDSKPPLTCDLTLFDTMIVNPDMERIPHDITQNGLYKIYATNLADINRDYYVGIDDITYAAEHFGESPDRPRWDPKCDMNGDDYIGIDDIVLVASSFGWAPKYDP